VPTRQTICSAPPILKHRWRLAYPGPCSLHEDTDPPPLLLPRLPSSSQVPASATRKGPIPSRASSYNATSVPGTKIARLDHSFERGLQEGTATYSMREDGGVRVLNRGYSPKKQEWSEAEGKAYFVREEDEGYLEVCFFWPFYGSYVIYDMDLDRYEWAAVCSSNHSYLWLLSRKPYVSKDVKRRFLERAKKLGFDTDALIFVEHGKAKLRRR